MEKAISQLVEYAVRHGWLTDTDRVWAANRILEILHMDGFGGLVPVEELPPVQEMLNPLCDYAYETGLIDGNSAAYYDLFDTKLIGALVPPPSQAVELFNEL